MDCGEAALTHGSMNICRDVRDHLWPEEVSREALVLSQQNRTLSAKPF